MRVYPNSYTEKMENFQSVKADISCLILGNSHAYYGLNPSFFPDKTYNLANLSQSIDIDRLLLEHDIAKMPKLKRIILPISTFSMNFRIEDSEESWRKYDYLYYAGFEQAELNIPKYELRAKSMVLGKGISSCMKIMLKILKGEDLRYCSNLGWANNYQGSNISSIVANSEKTAKRHNSFEYSFEANKVILEGIISKCEERGIELVLVNLPVSKPYYTFTDQEKWVKVVAELSDQAAENSHVRYINWIQKEGFGIEFFHDPDHLNHEGAEKVSKLLDHYLKQ